MDPQKGDYEGWESVAHTCGRRLEVVGSAEEALRLARATKVDLWVINTELPGLSGYELCSMLKARCGHAAVYLVADTYTPAAELAAWQVRATTFGCKPGHLELLHHWLQATAEFSS